MLEALLLIGGLIVSWIAIRIHYPRRAAREVVNKIRAGELKLIAGKNVCPTCKGVGFVNEPGS